MKKFKMPTSIIIIVVSVAVIIGLYYFLSNRDTKTTPEVTDTQITAVQNVLLRDLEKNYPPTPKEVLKYYSDITQCFYSNAYSEEELTELAQRAMDLYDDELAANQNEEEYLTNLKAEIDSYKQKDWNITSYSTSASTDVEYFSEDGDDWAQLYVTYNVRQATMIVKVTEQFLLRKDDDGHWKIFGWDTVTPEETEAPAAE